MAVRRFGLWMLLVCLAAAGGCKRVELTFVNHSDQWLDVHLARPGTGGEYVGPLPPMGRLRHDFTLADDDLPAECSWAAGPFVGRFLVEKKTDRKLHIDIGP